MVGNSGFLSGGDGDLGFPLELQEGSQPSSHVASGISGLLSTGCRGNKPHLELRQRTPCFSRVASGILGFLLSCNRELRIPLDSLQANLASRRAEMMI